MVSIVFEKSVHFDGHFATAPTYGTIHTWSLDISPPAHNTRERVLQYEKIDRQILYSGYRTFRPNFNYPAHDI